MAMSSSTELVGPATPTSDSDTESTTESDEPFRPTGAFVHRHPHRPPVCIYCHINYDMAKVAEETCPKASGGKYQCVYRPDWDSDDESRSKMVVVPRPVADANTKQYAGRDEHTRWITPWGKDVTYLCSTSSTGGFGSTQWTKNGWILDDFSMRELQKEFPDENLEKEANNTQSTLASPVSAEYRRGGGVVLPIAGQR